MGVSGISDTRTTATTAVGLGTGAVYTASASILPVYLHWLESTSGLNSSILKIRIFYFQ